MRKVSVATREESVEAVRGRYGSAKRPEKAQILNEFVAVTGFHRKHAMRLLRAQAAPEDGAKARPKRRIYDETVSATLVILWEAKTPTADRLRSSASFQRDGPRRERGDAMKTKMVSHTLETPPALTDAQREHLAELAALPDETIDTSDIPELSDEAWAAGTRGRFYRPVKQQITARVDADVLDWL